MRKTVAKKLREKARFDYSRLKSMGRRMGTFPNFFRFVKTLYLRGELKLT